ncbi:MAG TPA: class I SAM-dependent methyltransferase [Gemmatimonadales bacterium]|jgi:SAM-dependent methyltransferase
MLAQRSFCLLTALTAACSPARTADVIFLPSTAEVMTRMLELARIRPADLVYDLGCGDGRIVIAAVKRYGARGVCIDIDPALIAASRRNADTAGVRDRIAFRVGDMFEADLHGASVVALYLSPALNLRLRPKLFRELQPGARVVSHNFDMADWRPDTAVSVRWPTGGTSAVYAWVLPADVAGSWTLTVPAAGGDRRYRLRFEQRYQVLSGTASLSGRSIDLGATRLVGDSLEFELSDRRGGRRTVLRFGGRVSGGEMTGVVQLDSASSGRTWRATRASDHSGPSRDDS